MHELDKFRYISRVILRDPGELLNLARHAWTTLWFRYVRRCVGKGTVVGPHTRMINCANIRIGEHSWLLDMVYIRAGTEGHVEVGDRVAINSFCRIFGHGSVRIGDDAQVGPGTLITTTDHDFRGNLEASFHPVVIGKRAWIGANVTILPGVTIGDSAVVGAGSVVNKSIPARAIAVGIPARVIGSLDDPERKRETSG
jgi:acetyltransferase-like isoleucine patch superfamily enzyme